MWQWMQEMEGQHSLLQKFFLLVWYENYRIGQGSLDLAASIEIKLLWLLGNSAWWIPYAWKCLALTFLPWTSAVPYDAQRTNLLPDLKKVHSSIRGICTAQLRAQYRYGGLNGFSVWRTNVVELNPLLGYTQGLDPKSCKRAMVWEIRFSATNSLLSCGAEKDRDTGWAQAQVKGFKILSRPLLFISTLVFSDTCTWQDIKLCELLFVCVHKWWEENLGVEDKQVGIT